MKAIASNGTEIKTGDYVIVRDNQYQKWVINLFSYKDDDEYICTGSRWNKCYPYKGNEDLVGTDKDIKKEKEKKFKFGDKVEVRESNIYTWEEAIYITDTTNIFNDNQLFYLVFFPETKKTNYFSQCRSLKNN